ncbi:MAG: hypothetical protein DHS20C18_22150 [Saprospiraceae bacterium]|nr:MAG: hypothetical protein DHS20C18_22150 [Saprospiraceae bacterium]
MGFSQLNMSLLSQLDYNVSLNDIWGWADGEGNEYALVGAANGVSIVNVTDPENAVEVAFVPGVTSIWRDIKTWGTTAYVTTDQGADGLTVIDLSDLPNSAPYYYWTPTLPDVGGVLAQCHNIYIDEFGFAYLAGCNLNDGGMLFIDVASTPGTPIYAGAGPNIYAHDVYTRDNKMYASEIYLGRMGIYDVSDKDNSQLLGSQNTPFSFTHNIWLSDDGNVAFTTDERANAPIGAYDVSDPTDIIELDQFRPIETVGEDVIPHNVHVWNDWLVISYYTDGGIIVDASRPTNLIEVGNFDTFLGVSGGFSGAWGLYPFLPSGIVLVSDIDNGLYVCDAVYVRACWLEGEVTNAQSGALLDGVEVEIFTSQANQATTDLLGAYETGLATAGTYDVQYSKAGYVPKTISVELENGVLTIENVALEPILTISGHIVSAENGNSVPNAQIVLTDGESDFLALSNEDGNFSLVLEPGSFDIIAGAWGYQYTVLTGNDISGNTSLTIELEEGYQDDFIFDYNWTTDDGDASAGFWERGEPIGTFRNNGIAVNPGFDISTDIGDQCYVTGNGGGNSGDDDVDDGTVVLTSPVMDLSGYESPELSYYLWWYNDGGNGSDPDDQVAVIVSNGTDEVEIEVVTQSGSAWRPISEFNLVDYITITDNMTVRFVTGDFDPTGHLVEAAVDAFLVVEGEVINGLNDPLAAGVRMEVFPNPFQEAISLRYTIDQTFETASVEVFNALGQKQESLSLQTGQGNVQLGAQLNPGLYTLRMVVDGRLSQTKKVIKMK